jgi:predicted GNAT family N-acyltransferase
MIFGMISFMVFKMRTIIQKINDDTFIYFSEQDLLKKEFDIVEIQKIGYIQFTIDTESEEVNVGYIFVSEIHRGKKFGKQLIEKMIRHTYKEMKRNHISRYEIKLDDMSVRYGMKNNLYIKTGFSYCEIDEGRPCGPEMSMTIDVCDYENEK